MPKRKSAAKKAPAKQAAKKSPAKKTPTKRAAPKRPTKKPAAKRLAQKSPAKKTAAKKSPVRRPAKKTPAKKPAARRKTAAADIAAEQPDAYQRHKARARTRQSEKSKEGRDIAAEMPKITDPKLRARVTKSLRLFCEKCLSERFYKGWSKDHLTAIKKMERAILEGDNFALAMPRGTGKTTLVIAAVMWAILCGHKSYVALIGADRDAATKLLDGLKVELETNDLLLDLFPEAVYPIRKLEGIANRCRGQLYQGDRTYIRWTAKHIQFASIPKRGEVGNTASGAIVETAGIRGKIRGMQQALPSGTIARPDMFVVDDPQTDTSAKSGTQCRSRLTVITGTCPGLAGPGESISGFVTCTVIEPDDVADQLLNAEKFPDFHGERMQLVYAWPDDTDLWEQYANIYRESMATEQGMGPCNKFVLKHWDAMHAGASVAWDDRKRKDEVSPLQHAYNLLLRLGDTFWQEYQNTPRGDDDCEDLLSVDEIQAKVNGFTRHVLPPTANLITAYIDVQGECLYFCVVGTNKSSFDGWILDYGTWPKQTSLYFTKRKLGKKLSAMYKGRGLEGRIRQGIMDLTARLATTDYMMPDGKTSGRIKRIGIDAAWGKTSSIIFACAIESPHRSLILPTFGRGLDASKLPMEFWTAKPGETLGVGYAIRPRPGGGMYALLDSNYWKSFLHSRFAVSLGDRGSMSLFTPEQITTHRMYAEHLRSEKRTEDTNGSRVVPIWTHPDNGPDNDFLDSSAGALAMAGIEGTTLADMTVRRTAKTRGRRRTTLRV